MFEQIGEGHKIMSDGPNPAIDLDRSRQGGRGMNNTYTQCDKESLAAMVENVLRVYEASRDDAHLGAQVELPAWKFDLLVERIRELEAENANLRRELKAALERC